jgi:peptidoglycan/LPS O-acetylase OafA/YrhL
VGVVFGWPDVESAGNPHLSFTRPQILRVVFPSRFNLCTALPVAAILTIFFALTSLTTCLTYDLRRGPGTLVIRGLHTRGELALSQNLHLPRFLELDGLRGLAAATVACAHLGNADMDVIYGVPLASQARLAVWVFFVLSAFLLTHQAVAASDAGEERTWLLPYFLRRIFRIYPLFLFAVIIDVVVQRVPMSFAVDYVTLSSSCCHHIYWSIPPEFKCYFLIPIVGFVAARYPLASVAALLVAAIASIVFTHVYNEYNLYRFISTFLFGSIAAILFMWRPGEAKMLSRLWPSAIIVAALCSTPLIEATGWSVIPSEWNGLHGALWATVVLACAFGTPWLVWLASRPMRFLGKISFPLYLLHLWVVAAGTAIGLKGQIWAGPLLFAVMILVAWLAHISVEEPCPVWPTPRGFAVAQLV